MLKAEQVPKECLIAYQRAFKNGGGPADGITAAINAWPGAERIYRSADEKLFTIILSLPTEASND